MDKSYYKKWQECKWAEFNKKYFKSVKTYSRLLLDTKFYKYFIEYEFMLILQSDAVILEHNDVTLKHMMSLPYDYIGAPWTEGYDLYPFMGFGMTFFRKIFNPQKCYVGNGGLCLRRIDNTIKLINKKKFISKFWRYPEDFFFGYYGTNNVSFYKNAPVDIAKRFALEKGSLSELSNGANTFGIHAWELWLGNFEILKQYLKTEN